MSIVIFGSINMDLVARTPRLPEPGETLTGHMFHTFPGGKGANQAVACARLGVPTRMVGRVGGDVFGGVLRDGLRANGVDNAHIAIDPDVASGVAMIAVDDAAENNIIVIPGANGTVGEADLARLETALGDASLLLMQLEIPMDAVVTAAGLASEKSVTVVLDPAPAKPLPPGLYSLVDVLTPNETEAANLVDFAIHNEEDAASAAQVLLERGVKCAIIKMGSQGAYAADSESGHFYRAILVEAIDSVAAGDAFNSALAVALSEGKSFDKAMLWGLAGGALAVTKEGAQPSMPDREALMALLAAQ